MVKARNTGHGTLYELETLQECRVMILRNISMRADLVQTNPAKVLLIFALCQATGRDIQGFEDLT